MSNTYFQETDKTQGVIQKDTIEKKVENDIVFASTKDLVSSGASHHDSVAYNTSMVQSTIGTTPSDIINCDKILPNYSESIKLRTSATRQIQNDLQGHIFENGPTKTIVKALSEKLLKNKANLQNVRGVTMPGGSAVSLTNESNGISTSAINRENSASDSTEKSEEFQNVSTTTLTLPSTESTVTTSLTSQDTTTMSYRLATQTVLEVDPATLHHTVGQSNCFSDMVLPNMHHLASLQSNCVSDLQNSTPMRQNPYPVTTNSFYNQNGSFIYSPVSTSIENQIPDRDMMLERFIQQQQFYQEQPPQQAPPTQMYPCAITGKENYTMKSPDSGYHEPCLSPIEQQNALVRHTCISSEGFIIRFV